MGKRFAVATLGCRTNQYESQAAKDQLLQMGFLPAGEGEEADVCLVNTCTVTESADAASRSEIRGLLRSHPRAKVIVTGCMAERTPDAVKALGERVEVVSNRDKESVLKGLVEEGEALPEFEIRSFEGHTRAFVKVQDGCNSFCTYCIIPYVRGRSRSRPMLEVIQEIEGLVERGYKEVVLTGINIGDFDGGGGVKLVDLVRAADRVAGLKRLRISSIDPDEVDEELLEAVLQGAHTCPSMHVVLQAGSNAILKRMNRKYTKQQFLDTVERLVKGNGDFTITTDVIVGFPGETEGDFEETLDLLRRAPFAKVHVFPYSARPRTRAALYPNRVAPDVLRRRKERLIEEAERVGVALRERFVGRTMQVLMEEGNEGHTANFLKVRLVEDLAAQNELVDVELIGNGKNALIGRLA